MQKTFGTSRICFCRNFRQKEFTATAKLTFDARFDKEEVGLVVMGLDYGRLTIKRENGKLNLYAANLQKCRQGIGRRPCCWSNIEFKRGLFQSSSEKGGLNASLVYSSDGTSFTSLGNVFKAHEGKWIGAKVGFYALREGAINDAGSADIDWFRIEK